MLLDLSAAFDTVDYGTVVGPLANRLGTRDVVLQQLNWDLRGRTQTVTLMNAVSVLLEVLFGVPQG